MIRFRLLSGLFGEPVPAFQAQQNMPLPGQSQASAFCSSD